MVVNDDAYLLAKRGALESIASKLAPTKNQHYARRRGISGWFISAQPERCLMKKY